jgi:hypothetical protein
MSNEEPKIPLKIKKRATKVTSKRKSPGVAEPEARSYEALTEHFGENAEPTMEDLKRLKEEFLERTYRKCSPEGYAEQYREIFSFDYALNDTFGLNYEPKNAMETKALIDMLEKHQPPNLTRFVPEIEVSLSEQVVAGATSLLERQKKASDYLAKMLEEPYEDIFLLNFTCGCGAPMTDEEERMWSKCGNCRLEDIREPHADLTVRYAWKAAREGWKYDPGTVRTSKTRRRRHKEEFDDEEEAFDDDDGETVRQSYSKRQPTNDQGTEILARISRLETELGELRVHNEKLFSLENRLDSVIKALERVESRASGSDGGPQTVKPTQPKSKK